MIETKIIVVWADGAWCWSDDAEDFGSGRSDDTREVRVPIDMPEKEIDDIASMVAEGASDEDIQEEIAWWQGG